MKAQKVAAYVILVAGTAATFALTPMMPKLANNAPKGEIPAEAVTATGSAKGMDGDVTVEVIADENNIYSVKVTEQNETQGIGSIAVDQLPDTIYKAQSYNVDAVSGATITSEAIKNAVKNALESAGLDASKFGDAVEIEVEKAEDASYDTDIVVVGAGGAGMTAAIEAADAGANVILIDSQTMVGGNSIRATGGMNAADTKWQDDNEFAEAAGVDATLAKAASDFADNEVITELAATVQEQWDAYQADPEGYFDSVELMELDTMIGGKGINDIDLVKALVENTADGVDWLDSIGAEVHNVGAFGGASVKRIHRPVNEEGQTIAVGSYIVPILEENVTKRGIQILYSTTADEILTNDNGAVTGVHAIGSTGENVTINADAVILATGGFGSNAEMIESYKPELKGYMSTNAAGAQGQGIAMGTAIGAATVDMEQIQIHPTVTFSDAHLITEGLRGDGAILVNADGKRFFDEVGTRDAVSAAEIQQPGGYAWLVIDQSMVDVSAVIQGYISGGYTVEGKDYKELAKAMEVDEAAFEETMNNWNSYVDKKEDPEFGRTSFASKLENAPFYAIKVTPGIHHTMGGLKINASASVLKEDGSAIEGLYAAGEVTGGVHGANRLGGNAVADFIVYGRIAGQNAAAYTAEAKDVTSDAA